MRKLSLILSLLLLSVISTQAETGENAYNPLILEHDGLQRTVHVYEPDGDINAVMITLHGFYSSGRAIEAISGLNEIADERGWVMVYPESADVYWDDGRVDAGLPPVNEHIDDVGYLATLSDTLRETYTVDTVYLTGYAVGGTMAMRAVCETPDKYDGVAIVSALMWGYQTQFCNPAENPAMTDMILVKGEQDHIYWSGGRQIVSINQDILSAEATVTLLGDLNGCDSLTGTSIAQSGLVTGQNCDNDTRIAYVPVVDGGNNWSRTGDNSLNHAGIDTAQLIAAFFSGDENWQSLTAQENNTVEVPRSFTLYVPESYDPSTPTPVVLSLHGRGANNFSQALSSGFNQVAEEYGFIVVYPQAYDPLYNDPERADATWNYNRGTGLLTRHPYDDDAFLDAIVDDLALSLNVDMSRLYVSGLSNGGYMINHLACTRGDRYAAFASVSGNAPLGTQELCAEYGADEHAPILFYHGTGDIISPWAGATETLRPLYTLAPIPNTLNFWLIHNDCEQSYEQSTLDSTDYDSTVIYVRYTGCPDDSAVEMYAVVGGGHVWHGVYDFDSTLLGEVNMDINASEAIWEFYSRYTLEGQVDSSVELDIGSDTPVSGEGLPAIPMTLAEMAGDSVESPDLDTVAHLQRGGYTIYFAFDMAEGFDCEAETIDEAFLAEAEAFADAFSRMSVRISDVSALNDCWAISVADYFVRNDPVVTYEPQEIGLTLVERHQPGTIAIVIGTPELYSNVAGVDISPSNSVVILPEGNRFNPLAIVPPDGWDTVADAYVDIITSD